MVMRCVRVYIEGGAEGGVGDNDFRRGWKVFLRELHDIARNSGYHSLEIVRGKGRATTFRRFKKHRISYPNDLCVLLVDSETAVPEGTSVWHIVANRKGDNWTRPPWATERHLYLMVHFVETWLLTDPDALLQYFKQGFVQKCLPKRNIEDRSKKEIEDSLKRATKLSRKGPYRHGQAHEIIGLVAPDRVKALRHGGRLFEQMGDLIRGDPEAS